LISETDLFITSGARLGTGSKSSNHKRSTIGSFSAVVAELDQVEDAYFWNGKRERILEYMDRALDDVFADPEAYLRDFMKTLGRSGGES